MFFSILLVSIATILFCPSVASLNWACRHELLCQLLCMPSSYGQKEGSVDDWSRLSPLAAGDAASLFSSHLLIASGLLLSYPPILPSAFWAWEPVPLPAAPGRNEWAGGCGGRASRDMQEERTTEPRSHRAPVCATLGTHSIDWFIYFF